MYGQLIRQTFSIALQVLALDWFDVVNELADPKEPWMFGSVQCCSKCPLSVKRYYGKEKSESLVEYTFFLRTLLAPLDSAILQFCYNTRETLNGDQTSPFGI